MSAADAARKRADRTAQELLQDAVNLKLSLETLIRSLAEDGTGNGTAGIARDAMELDRRMAYLRGLREGLDLRKAGS